MCVKFRKNGSTKFASFTEHELNNALSRALKKGLILNIPRGFDNKLELLRKIAVVVRTNYHYAFLEEKPKKKLK